MSIRLQMSILHVIMIHVYEVTFMIASLKCLYGPLVDDVTDSDLSANMNIKGYFILIVFVLAVDLSGLKKKIRIGTVLLSKHSTNIILIIFQI